MAGSGEIIARATLYAALMTATSTGMLEIDGDLMVDGGFVNNIWYCRLLATLAGSERCFVNHQTEGTAVGAGMIEARARCTRLSAPNAARTQRYLSCHGATARSTVATASVSRDLVVAVLSVTNP